MAAYLVFVYALLSVQRVMYIPPYTSTGYAATSLIHITTYSQF